MSEPAPTVAGLRRYAAVWRIPGAPTLVVGGIAGRLPIAMAPLVLVLLVERSTGSYAVAGVAGASYALATAAVGPVLGRLADRLRPTPVLLATAFAWPVAAVLVLVATALPASTPVIWAASGLLGACLPPLTAALRSTWSGLTTGRWEPLRAAGLAVETTSFEVVFVLGPLLVGVLAALVDVTVALAVAAALAAWGTAAVALGPATRGWRPEPDRTRVRGLGPAVAPGMPLLLFVSGALTFAFGVIGVTVPAFADLHLVGDGDALAGLLFALWGVGSVTGGLWFGTRQFRASLPTQWGATLGAVAVGMAALALVPNAALMAVALLLSGLTLAPALTVENALVAAIAPHRMINEAYTWVVTISFVGSGLGSAVAGVLVDRAGGVGWAFALAGVATAAGAVVATLPGNPLRRATARA